MERYERITEYLESLQESDLVYMWTYYCQQERFCEDELYPMSYLDDLYFNRSALEVLNSIKGNFNITDYYFYYDGEELISTNDCYDKVTIDDLANYIDSTEEDFNMRDLRYLIEELNEEETEEE